MVQHKTHGFYICSRQNEFEGDVLSQKFISAYANRNYVTIDNTLLENKKKVFEKKKQFNTPSPILAKVSLLAFNNSI